MGDVTLTVFLGPGEMRTMRVQNGTIATVCLDKWAEGARAFMVSTPEPEPAPSEPTCTVAFLKATVLAMLQTNTPEGRLQVAMDAIREAEGPGT